MARQRVETYCAEGPETDSAPPRCVKTDCAAPAVTEVHGSDYGTALLLFRGIKPRKAGPRRPGENDFSVAGLIWNATHRRRSNGSSCSYRKDQPMNDDFGTDPERSAECERVLTLLENLDALEILRCHVPPSRQFLVDRLENALRLINRLDIELDGGSLRKEKGERLELARNSIQVLTRPTRLTLFSSKVPLYKRIEKLLGTQRQERQPRRCKREKTIL
jgi:hypothetical protein